jgi:hypothetical protein
VTARWKSASAAAGTPLVASSANVRTRTMCASTGSTVAVAGVGEDAVAV